MSKVLAFVAIVLMLGCRQDVQKVDVAKVPQKSLVVETDQPLPDPKPQVSKVPPELLLATFNINFGNARLDLVCEAIQESNADIVALQETNAESEAALTQAFAAKYPHHKFIGNDRIYYAGRSGVLSRFPMSEATAIKPADGWFEVLICRFDLGGEALELVNVHLTPFRLEASDGLTKALTRLGETEVAHRLEIEQIHQHMHDDVRTVVLGDFNSMSSFAAPKFLLERGFTDSFAAVHDNPDQHPTWEWPLRSGKFMLRIDYIFHDASLETVASQVIRKDASDHHLLMSKLRLNRNAKPKITPAS